ncbi:MAG TPA: hypothetical protein VL093_03455 [Flavipsychrobacter sp.]|jgi:hypothetical protein|nr:hypothetical protein [Flavipsychrobacter sp.]
MKKLLLVLFALVFGTQGQAQTDVSKIINSDKEITWLGVDFTQLKFIGSATQWKDAGEITSSQLRDKYFPAWNNLFINEQKKYNVADAVNRAEVGYATEVTEKANNTIKGNLFTDDPDEYSHLTEQKVAQLVSKYDFKGKKGIGMMFFAESFSKGREEGAIWVTFVDMNAKKLLMTKRLTERAGGFGFKNYWAKTLFNALKDTRKL